MLPKTPKSGFWKFVKGSAKTLFVIEAVCFAASYGVYYRMNTNRGKQCIYVIKVIIIKCCEIHWIKSRFSLLFFANLILYEKSM